MAIDDGKDDGKGKDEGGRWDDGPTLPGITGNARWELTQALRNERVKAELVVPAFVRLNLEDGRTVADVVRFLAERKDVYSLSDHEMDSLVTEAETRREGAEILAVILCSPDAVEAKEWTVLHVGPPQARSYRQTGYYAGEAIARQSGPLSCTPVLGVVDDSIGFLHHRFRRADGSTRFQSLWLMHAGLLADDPSPATGGVTLFGIELTAADINARIAMVRTEEAQYRRLNNAVHGPVARKGTNHHVGHGTHVLDLACGALAGEAMADVPILGVQLSPGSIGDTSGRRLEPDIARALRLIVNRALRRKERAALVINLSLGALAGPQDGTSFLEIFIAAEIARYQFLSRNAPIRVVIAYGNAWRQRLVARRVLKPGQEVTLDWRIQPDDRTPSFLELRTEKGAANDIAIRLQPPDGGPVLSRPTFPPFNVVWQYPTPRGPAAEVQREPEVNFATAMITVAATVADANLPVAPSGPWRLTLRNTGTKAREITAKVQRDDTPGGYRPLGRQSWLDHPTGWAWEAETRAVTMPGPGSPITRKGTEVGYSGVNNASVYFAGAARPDLLVQGGQRPSSFTSEGGLPGREGPTLSARSDDGSALRGVRAAGVRTGSTARLSGTSMATPMISRRLLEYAMTGQMGLLPNDAELAFILGQPPMPVIDSRLGRATVVA
jgi:Subtilase family